MTSRGVLTLAVVLLLVTAGCLGSVSGSTDGDAPAAQADATDVPTLSASGTGEVSADPDRALVRFAVVAEADTAEAARELAAQRADGVRDALADAGVGEEDLRATQFSLSARYDYGERERELVGYGTPKYLSHVPATRADLALNVFQLSDESPASMTRTQHCVCAWAVSGYVSSPNVDKLPKNSPGVSTSSSTSFPLIAWRSNFTWPAATT